MNIYKVHLYSAVFSIQSAQTWITQFLPANYTHACILFVSIHQMAPPVIEVADVQLQLTTHLLTQTDERLSWPGWLTCYSGWFAHISGHRSSARQG